LTLAPAALDRLLAQAVEREEVVGVVAMVDCRDGPLYAAAHGRRGIASDDPMTLDTVFMVASMAKAVTTVAAMQLVEQGLLDLDEPVANIMPDLAKPQILTGFDQSGAPLLKPASRPITLRHLMAHTSGFGEDIWSADIRRYFEWNRSPSFKRGRRGRLSQPLLFEPGERWQYGVSHDWIGLMVEAVGKLPLDRYLRKHVLDPLGMHDTGYVLDEEQAKRLAGMHRREADGTLRGAVKETPSTRDYVPGGGALYSTGPDYLRFLRMLLDDGRGPTGQVLRPETVAQMREIQPGTADAGFLDPGRLDLSNPVDFLAGVRGGWGLSFLINAEQAPTGRSAGSLAWAGLCNTYYWVDPAAGIAAVLLTQVLPFADSAVLALLDAFERAVYADARTGEAA
jgi:CubicO group peptidase (beta-lactamase class C family)